MAPRFIPVNCIRRLLIKRRFSFGVMLTSLPLLGYLLLFSSSESRLSTSVPGKILSLDFGRDCPCATKNQTQNNILEPQTEAIATSFTGEQKVEHESTKSPGTLNVHMWSAVCGTNVDVLRNWPHFPYFPDKRSFISEFRKTQVANGENSGERIFGFVHPQVSGMYKFAITSDDTSELWLSRNEDPASSEMIARVYSPNESTWTEEGDYKKYPEQISKEIFLHADQKYYIESLSKQGSGAAHVAVFWRYGDSAFEIISSKYLSNFSQESTDHESIPPHAGKHRKRTLRNNSYLYYFSRLPLISKKEYINLIPTCSYSPSFLVHKKLERYQGVTLPNLSKVFPQDDTNMLRSGRNLPDDEWLKPNALVDNNTAKSVAERFINSLQSK